MFGCATVGQVGRDGSATGGAVNVAIPCIRAANGSIGCDGQTTAPQPQYSYQAAETAAAPIPAPVALAPMAVPTPMVVHDQDNLARSSRHSDRDRTEAKMEAKPKRLEASHALERMHETIEKLALGNSSVETNKTTNFDKVKAELAADPIIVIPGIPGDLRVSIGDTDSKPNFPSDMLHASAVIVTSAKPRTVLVKPNANAFNVKPESICSKFDPTGTIVNFKLEPKLEQPGKFRVGAGVWLYDSDGCTGTPNPKEAPDLQVEVVVKIIPTDLTKITREAISEFWVKFVGLIVLLLLFFARNLLKKVFGFETK
jgi:hypothetical protein